MKRFLFLGLFIVGCAKPPIDPPPPPPANGEAFELNVTAKDSRGYWNASIEFPDQPASIDSTTSFTSKVKVDLGEYCDVYKVSSFNGLDRGDIVEMDTFIYDQFGRVLYQRSKHKETDADFDSFVAWDNVAYTKTIDIHMHAHVTDPNEPARAHWNVTIWCKDSETVDPPDPPDPPGSENYYTLKRAGVLPPDYTQNCDGGTNMTLALCTQRQNLWHQGYTGPGYAVTHCRPHFPTIGLNANEIEAYVATGKVLLMEVDHYITRLSMENETYPGRSVVNKKFYEPFQDRLKAHLLESEAHNAACQTDPCREHTAYDSLQGWCGRCYK